MQKAEKVREMLKMQLESGLSVREFCFNQGIAHATFYNQKKWLAAYEKKRELAPITIKPSEIRKEYPPQKYFVHKDILESGLGTSHQIQVLEIKYPNGIELRLSSAKLDVSLLQTLLNPQAR